MNYKLHYEKLISKAQNRSILKLEYKEIHHIIPKCIGGNDDKENLIALFPEEHALAHLLLVKIYKNNLSLIQAANIMLHGGNNKQKRTNKSYKWLRLKHSNILSVEYKGVNNPNSKEWVLISPLNKQFDIGISETLMDFSIKHNLNIGDLTSVANNKLNHSKFWLCFYKLDFSNKSLKVKVEKRDVMMEQYNYKEYVVTTNSGIKVFTSKKLVSEYYNLSNNTIEKLLENDEYIPKKLIFRNIIQSLNLKIKKTVPQSLLMV